MKRTLVGLLALFLALTTAGTVEAKGRRSKPKKTTPETVLTAVTPGAIPGPEVEPERKQQVTGNDGNENVVPRPGPVPFGPPNELQMTRASSRRIDLRRLPQTAPDKVDRPERPEPTPHPVTIENRDVGPDASRPSVPVSNAPAPAPLMNFDGLDFNNFGSGHPPDTVGDVGPQYYIQSINASLGIYQKSDGVRVAAFTLDTFMSQGNFGNLCDTDNFGDPVVLYDTFEDRWVITDFAFQLDGGNNVVNPPGAFQCFAVSMTGDPVNGGWNFYSINTAGGLGDYPKLGIWPDGLYMSLNMFGYASGAAYLGPRVYAFNKAQMYAGSPTVQVVTFNPPAADFTLLPSNARLQTGTPPPGTPNYFLSSWQFLNALTVYKLHVDWTSVSLSTFTGPDVPLAATSWPNAGVANAPSQGGSALDVLQIRAMMQNQYTNLGGVESLWATHTVRRGNTTGFAAPRWYQVNVTGGTVDPNIPQAATWDPDAANVMHRFMPTLAVDRAGNMALGYSTSSTTTKPAIKYAARLAADPVNTLSQTEQVLIQGAGTQVGTSRWGDYAAMSLDPDGCTFWLTHMYYAVDGLNHQTRIGSFVLPSCTPVGAGGTVQGTVTATVGGAPLSGVTVALGARTTTTNGSGFYSFSSIPAGTYPLLTATFPGYNTETAAGIVVTDGGTTTQDFTLDTAPASACPADTTASNFLTGTPVNVDVTTTPGSVILGKPSLDQFNNTIGTSGVGITVTTWGGQTFTPAVSGLLTHVDVNLFCSGCTGTTPNLTLSIRATAAGLPTGADLATATIPGFGNGGVASYFTATFGTPPTLTAGTMYAFAIRPTANPAPGTYALTRSGTSTVGANVYAGGTRVAGATSGTVWSIPTTGGVTTDAGFRTYIDSGYVPSGTFVSSVKDSNPAAGLTPMWTTLSFGATLPASTSLRFQVGGSNALVGPFTFVGPDGTAATYFTTSGASIAQFYNFRYLQYKAYLDTADTAVTPALEDVTVCYAVADCSGSATIGAASQVCESSVGNTATGPAGATSYFWSITNGTITGGGTTGTVTYTAGASGNVGLTLDIVEAGGCHKSGTTSVPILAVPTPTITPGGPTTFCAGGSVTLTSSSASGNQWSLNNNPIGGATGQQYVATAGGNYTVVVTDTGCNSAPSSATTVTVDPIPATPTITPDGPTTICTGGSVTLTSSSASGNQWYLDGNPIGGATGQQYVATAGGNYTVTVTASGCESLPSSATTVTVNPIPATPTITPGGPTTFCTGGSVTLTSSSASGNQWSLDGNPIGGATSQQYVATTAGTYTVVVTLLTCSSSASAGTVVTINPTPATPTITPGGPTTFCTGGSVTLTSSSASGNQWYLEGNPIGAATGQQYVATASGNYTVVVTTGGCPSAASTTTAVTVNPTPTTPTITPGGPTTFCVGGSVTLTSSGASGNQWYQNGNPIGGATNQQYVANAAGNYTVVVTLLGCPSAASSATTVTITPTPQAPVITPGGPTTFCTGGSVTLTSSSAAGNQWSLNGSPIGGATGQQYVATASGNYTVTETTGGCTGGNSVAVTVTVTPLPPTPTITTGGPTTFCTGGSVTLTSSSATGNQWYLGGNPIGGATGQQYVATATGNYTVNVTASGCTSLPSTATAVTVNPIPATPIIGTSGPTTFCAGGSVTLTSSTATGNQWYLGGNPIGGATGQQYVATASGNYTVGVTQTGCSGSQSAATVVTVNPIPATPTITPAGPTTFCTGGSVTLNSSSATGNQWRLNGNPIGGATSQAYVATGAGDYTVTVTTAGCTSAPSAATTVTINPDPDATITAPASVVSLSTGNTASVANAGVGATYNWVVGNGTITAGTGTASITFTAGAAGTVAISVTVTTAGNCSDVGTANPAITAAPVLVTVTSVVPPNGPFFGGKPVTINGTGFNAGATVTFGGTAATNVVVVNSTKITAKTPTHAPGAVNVTVTNTNASSGTLTNGYTYRPQQFDPNGDNVIDPSDIFYLVNYLFLNGPAPAGTAGMPSGDANGDGVVDPADIFFTVAYLFTSGPQPESQPGAPVATTARPVNLSGAVSLGQPAMRNGRVVIPVLVSAAAGSVTPQSVSLSLRFDDRAGNATIRRAGAAANVQPVFEISRGSADTLSWLISFDERTPLDLGSGRSAVIAELELAPLAGSRLAITIDPKLTMLSTSGGTQSATVAKGTLQLRGITLDGATVAPRPRNDDSKGTSAQ